MLRLRSTLLGAVLLASGCDTASADADDVERAFERVDEATQLVESPNVVGEADPAGETPQALADVADAPDADVVEIARDREPIAWRITKQRLAVYAQPSKGAPIRARIPIHKAFEVFAHVEGTGCGGLGWADVGSGGYVCLEETRKAGSHRAKELPPMLGGLTPFFYARVKQKGPPARRWKNLEAYLAGKDPIDTLQRARDYAFKYRKRHKKTHLLIDDNHRVVLEKEVHRYRPSGFEGRDLVESPVPAGRSLAWANKWPEAAARTEPSLAASVAKPVRYHTELLVDAEPIAGEGGPFYRLDDGRFVREAELRVWVPSTSVPSGVGTDELWIDVDVEQQTLAAMRGGQPVFATLISSGFKRATPRGVFRIYWKQAIGGMQSEPGADDPYNIDAVPHVQYFVGGFALHSAYWHHAFGRPVSHGCVNLAPKDALRVFRLTAPQVRKGWLTAYETEHGLGTTIRIRKGDREPRDRRRSAESLFGA